MDKSLMPKTKHDHKWTDKLKVIIFALLMLAPLFSVLVKCLYTLNPNAKDSYYGETINNYKYIKVDNIKNNEEYTWISTQIPDNNNIPFASYYVEYVKFITYTGDTTDYTNILNDAERFTFYQSNNIPQLVFYDEQNQILKQFDVRQFTLKFNFIYLGNSLTSGTTQYIQPYIYNIKYENYSYLDNVFYYSVNQIKEESLFKWVDNTIVYDGLNAMNTGFGLPSNHVLTYLLAYWTILTAIYIIIDIILFLFTKLTHLLQ